MSVSAISSGGQIYPPTKPVAQSQNAPAFSVDNSDDNTNAAAPAQQQQSSLVAQQLFNVQQIQILNDNQNLANFSS